MKRLAQIIIATTLLTFTGTSLAATTRVAVATNFLRPAQQLATLFSAATGIRVECSGSSTGKLYAQIKNGAPYQLFLAADALRPELLHQAGLAQPPRTYAKGQVVLWSRLDLAAADWQQALTAGSQRIAIANPDLAPYGEAAAVAMQRVNLRETLKPRLIFAQSVGQSFQYAERGATRFAFVARSDAASEIGKKGTSWPTPEAPLVVQKGCLIGPKEDTQAARQFFDFLFSPQGRQIITAAGYQ